MMRLVRLACLLLILHASLLFGADANAILSGLESQDAAVVVRSITAITELGANDRARARGLVVGLVGDADPTRPKKIADDEVIEQAMIRLVAWDDAGTKQVLACATHRPRGDVRAVRALAWLGDRALPSLDAIIRLGDAACAQTAVEAVESMTITDADLIGAAIAILIQQALPEDTLRQEFIWRAVGALLAAHPDIYNTRGAEMTLPALAVKWGPALVVAHQQLAIIRNQDPMQTIRYLVNGTCDYFLYLAKDRTIPEAQRCAYLEGVLVVADKRRLAKAVEVLESLLVVSTSSAPWNTLNTYLDRYLESDAPIGRLPLLADLKPPGDKLPADERARITDAQARYQRVVRLAAVGQDQDASVSTLGAAMPDGGWAQALQLDDAAPEAWNSGEAATGAIPTGEALDRLVTGKLSALNKARQSVDQAFLATANRMQELHRLETGRLAQDLQRWQATNGWTETSDDKPFGPVWLVRRQRNPTWVRLLATIKHYREQLDGQAGSARNVLRQMRDLESTMRAAEGLRLQLTAAARNGLPVGTYAESLSQSLVTAEESRVVAYPLIAGQRAYADAAERRYLVVFRLVPRPGG